MKLKLLILLIFTINLNAFSQTIVRNDKSPNNGLSCDELTLAKDLYTEMMKTQTYIDLNNNIKLLIEKTNYEDQNFTNNQEYEDWIKLNLHKTKFKSISEAIKLIELGQELTNKRFEENKFLYEMISRSTISQLHEILEPERANRPF